MTGAGRWRPHDYEGVWKFGPAWARPLVAAVPWITACVALVMLAYVQNTLSVAPGVDFELPAGTCKATDVIGPVAVLMPVAGSEGTFVFFDDARYRISEGQVATALAEGLAARLGKTHATLLLLADRRVPTGDVMAFAQAARKAGAAHVRVAEKAN